MTPADFRRTRSTVVRSLPSNWDIYGGAYASVEEFITMCRTCHGEAPTLEETPDGWASDSGKLLLVRH
jgi:hypothetical protein